MDNVLGVWQVVYWAGVLVSALTLNYRYIWWLTNNKYDDIYILNSATCHDPSIPLTAINKIFDVIFMLRKLAISKNKQNHNMLLVTEYKVVVYMNRLTVY